MALFPSIATFDLLCFICLSFFALIQAQYCYFPSGDNATLQYPCEHAYISQCCPWGWTCFSNHLCIVTDAGAIDETFPVGTAIRSTCTDPEGDETSCAGFCLDDPIPQNNGSVQPCGNNNFCCQYQVDAGTCDCSTGNGVFRIANGEAQTIIGVSSMASTNTGSWPVLATAFTTSSTSSPTSSPVPSMSNTPSSSTFIMPSTRAFTTSFTSSSTTSTTASRSSVTLIDPSSSSPSQSQSSNSPPKTTTTSHSASSTQQTPLSTSPLPTSQSTLSAPKPNSTTTTLSSSTSTNTTSSAAPTSSPSSSSHHLSTGAKAGIAVSVVVVAAAIIAVLMVRWYRNRREDRNIRETVQGQQEEQLYVGGMTSTTNRLNVPPVPDPYGGDGVRFVDGSGVSGSRTGAGSGGYRSSGDLIGARNGGRGSVNRSRANVVVQPEMDPYRPGPYEGT